MKFRILIRSPKSEKRIARFSFKEAKELAIKAKKKYKDRPDVQVYLYSCQKTFAPPEGWENNRRGKHFYWCPYCAAERKYKLNPRWDKYQCPICEITESDYWVKTYNHLWHKDEGKRSVKKR